MARPHFFVVLRRERVYCLQKNKAGLAYVTSAVQSLQRAELRGTRCSWCRLVLAAFNKPSVGSVCSQQHAMDPLTELLASYLWLYTAFLTPWTRDFTKLIVSNCSGNPH
jgi:hypothetical protein